MLGLQRPRLHRRVSLLSPPPCCEHIELETIFSSGYSFLVEMVTRCERRGYQVGELPIIFRDREAGAYKVSRAEIYRSVYTILRLRFHRLPWERWARLK